MNSGSTNAQMNLPWRMNCSTIWPASGPSTMRIARERTPKSLLHSNRAVDSFSCTNSIHRMLERAPASSPATAAALVMARVHNAPMYIGRKAQAHNPKKIAVPRATMAVPSLPNCFSNS